MIGIIPKHCANLWMNSLSLEIEKKQCSWKAIGPSDIADDFAKCLMICSNCLIIWKIFHEYLNWNICWFFFKMFDDLLKIMIIRHIVWWSKKSFREHWKRVLNMITFKIFYLPDFQNFLSVLIVEYHPLAWLVVLLAPGHQEMRYVLDALSPGWKQSHHSISLTILWLLWLKTDVYISVVSGPMKAPYMISFVQRFLYPLKPIHTEWALAAFLSKHDVSLWFWIFMMGVSLILYFSVF